MVIMAAVTLKIPRFFHFKLTDHNGALMYETTALMEDPMYIWFSAYWDDLFATGFLPFTILIYLNARIYLKVKFTQTFNLYLNNVDKLT